MNNSRVLGNNIALEMDKMNIGVLEFSEKIGFTVAETHKLIEGRLFLPPFQVKKIANVLEVSVDELLECRERQAYDKLIHNFGEFSKLENRELVLDIIDMYADLEEALQ